MSWLLGNIWVLSSSDNLCKQFGSKPFDALIVLLKEFFEKVNFEKKSDKSLKNYPACKELSMVRVERLPFGNVSQDVIFVISAKLYHPFPCKTKLSFYVISNNDSLEALITLYCLIGNIKKDSWSLR